ncbi:hypothetical protein HGRIS_013991 [Hohenbuehelia grisea]|uniref:Uncharacterized protein n=1 Tax=Hohenbuehelia grisea TaxID=104357 RepID=A0ABR3JSN8_9AGAR
MLDNVLGFIRILVDIATPISELNPAAKVVFGLVSIIQAEWTVFIKRHEPVMALLEEVGNLIEIIKLWKLDDPERNPYHHHLAT